MQFGTGRFLQAHVDLFVSEALAAGKALGRIAVVQSTNSAESTRRLSALARGSGYRVEIRGMRDGLQVEETVHVQSIGAAWHAGRDWTRIVDAMGSDVQVVVSNTADRGYEVSAADRRERPLDGTTPPSSFPAKLLVLLHHRWRRQPHAALCVFPCELVHRNGDTLRDVVVALASAWRLPEPFVACLRQHCIWINSLVDRIVPASLDPVGAIAEPYALWAIEKRQGMVLPCEHPAVTVTNELGKYERLKLMLLNLGHSYLAERWLTQQRPSDETVRDAMADAGLRAELEEVWNREVLPVFDAVGEGCEARAYLADVRDRFCNPFLAHRLADIAVNHAQKKQRRFVPAIELAANLSASIEQPRLRAAARVLRLQK